MVGRMGTYYGVYLIFLLTLFFYIQNKLALLQKFTIKNVLIFIPCSFIVYLGCYLVLEEDFYRYNEKAFSMICLNITSIFLVFIVQYGFKHILGIKNAFYETLLFSLLYPVAYFIWSWVFFFVLLTKSV